MTGDRRGRSSESAIDERRGRERESGCLNPGAGCHADRRDEGAWDQLRLRTRVLVCSGAGSVSGGGGRESVVRVSLCAEMRVGMRGDAAVARETLSPLLTKIAATRAAAAPAPAPAAALAAALAARVCESATEIHALALHPCWRSCAPAPTLPSIPDSGSSRSLSLSLTHTLRLLHTLSLSLRLVGLRANEFWFCC